MKLNTFLVCLILALTSSYVACATDQADSKAGQKASSAVKAVTREKGKPSPKRVQKARGVELTGSHIKQDVRINGRITDGATQVVVIDHNALERSGAADLRQALSLSGVR